MSELLLARSELATVYIAYVDAFPEGFELKVEAIAHADVHAFRCDGELDIFGRHWPMVGQPQDAIPPQLIRIGVQFADGRKATNTTGHTAPADGPVMWPLQGGAGWSGTGEDGGRFDQGYWVSPMPPLGVVALVVEWPAAGISLVRHEIDAQVMLDAAERARSLFPTGPQVRKDDREWRLGTAAEIEWINHGTSGGGAITTAIPPVFDSYCILELPGGDPSELKRHEAAVIELLTGSSGEQSWWLGYLDTGASDVVFPHVPRVTAYYGYGYVLVEAGPRQAAGWRTTGFNWALPDLMFPADRSWLVSTMWDDGFTSIGGSERFVSSFLDHPLLGPKARRVRVGPQPQ